MASHRPKRVTLADVAAEAGVSRTTASYILAQSRGGFAQETIERVTRAAAKLGYSPNPIAQSLRTGRTLLFGFIIPADLEASQQHVRCRIEFGIAEEMRKHRMDMVQVIVPDDEDPCIGQVKDLLNTRLVNGLIVYAPQETPLVPWLQRQEAPFVVIGTPAASDVTSVDFDNVAIGHCAAQHLIDVGHVRLVYIASPQCTSRARDRASGFSRCCADAGISDEQARVVYAEDSTAGGYNAMREVLAAACQPTGVCAGDDWIANGAAAAIREAGMRVPEDISVLGCNNDGAACTDRDFLTTVDLDFAELGALAARKLVALLGGKPTARRRTVGHRLIPRKSTGPAISGA